MNYQSVNDILQQLAVGIDASEAHGMATGMLSIAKDADPVNWLQGVLLENVDQQTSANKVLLDCFEETRSHLDAGFLEFDFDLLLPDDDEPCSEQAAALGLWCEGYLVGVGYSHANIPWPSQLEEIMRDMIELTKIDCDDHDAHDAENDLMQIREYVRAAVFMVRDFFWDRETTPVRH